MSRKKVTLYKYVTTKHLYDILKNNRLYLNDGMSFNDPFEITVTDKNTKAIEKVKGLHILSLTNSHIKKLMWSYYTDSHKGVCLTVQIPQDMVYPVCYSSSRIYNDSNLDKIIENAFRANKKCLPKPGSEMLKNKKIAFIKDKKWKDEKEFRVVIDQSEEEKLIKDKMLIKKVSRSGTEWFLKVKIKNVYLGVNFDKNEDITRKKLDRLCSEANIKVTELVLDADTYSLKKK